MHWGNRAYKSCVLGEPRDVCTEGNRAYKAVYLKNLEMEAQQLQTYTLEVWHIHGSHILVYQIHGLHPQQGILEPAIYVWTLICMRHINE